MIAHSNRLLPTVLALLAGLVPEAIAETQSFECPESIARIVTSAPDKITVYTQGKKIAWFQVTPSGLQERRSMQLAHRDSLTHLWENGAFSVLQIARNQDYFGPAPHHYFFQTLDADSGKIVDERDRPAETNVHNVFLSETKLFHDDILDRWKLTKGDRAWHMHAVRITLKWMDEKVAIGERAVEGNKGELFKVTEFDSGRTHRFKFPKLARLVAASGTDAAWHFYVHEGDRMLLHSKTAQEPVAFPVKDFRQANGFRGGCIVETQEGIYAFPWDPKGRPRLVLKRDGAEWTYGGNERYGIAAKIGTKTIHQFEWKPTTQVP